jgi:hypothetical protein
VFEKLAGAPPDSIAPPPTGDSYDFPPPPWIVPAHLGHVTDAPVMILKSCIGNRALGWDLLPPGSEGFEFTDDKGVTWIAMDSSA